MKKLAYSLLVQKLVELATMKPLFIVLIGAPGAGKSTFISKLGETLKFIVASTDDQIDSYARAEGLTYSQAFERINFKTLKKQMMSDIAEAASLGKSVIVDQTNMHRKSRKEKLAAVGHAYAKVAIVFDVDEKALLARLTKREAETGKGIPKHVVFNMLKSYEAPSAAEGFDACFTYMQTEQA